jgi:hypothetical protein
MPPQLKSLLCRLAGELAPRCAGRLGNAFERRLLRFLAGPRQIGQRDDSDQPLVAVEDRQSPHLMLGHHLCRILEVTVLEAEEDAFRHDVADRRDAGALLLGDGARDDVAVGDHAACRRPCPTPGRLRE